MADDDDGLLARASDHLKATAARTINRDTAKAALSMKLIVVGLTLVCFSGGVDYFSHDDEIHHAVSVAARDAGQGDLADVVDRADERVDDAKKVAIASIPPAVRENLALAAFALGGLSLAVGLRMKVRASPGRRGTIIHEVGWAIAGPGIGAILVFCFLNARATPVVKGAVGSFFGKLRAGELSASDVASLTTHYAPWAWGEVGAVLLVGLGCAVLAIGGYAAHRRLAPRRFLTLEIAWRTAERAAVLSLAYYLAATVLAIVSYGGALRVVVWPWKIDAPAFLGTLALLSFGLGLARTGKLEHRREEAEAAAEAGASSKKRKGP